MKCKRCAMYLFVTMHCTVQQEIVPPIYVNSQHVAAAQANALNTLCSGCH